MTSPASPGRLAPALWGLGGVLALLTFAVYRLGRRGLTAVQQGLTTGQWLALAVLVVFFVYTEGADALQRRWVPRVIKRVADLRRGEKWYNQVLAPLFAMSLVGASRRDTIRAWVTTVAIIVAVLVVRTFPHPWRGITDVAVACGLAWGVGAMLVQAPKAFR